MPVQTTFHERMINEYNELQARLEKLLAYINTAQFYSLSNLQQTLLKAQAGAMDAYANILKIRIDTN